jgi:hypothetical protein
VPGAWFAGKDQSSLDMHLIPNDAELWKLERFEDFIAKRKKLVQHHFAY